MAYNPKTLAVSQGGTSKISLTAHNLIVGNGASIPNQVAPSATAGVPLVSAGASADPSYGTAVVAGGGTGITSATAYAPICAGTTATGNFQAADTGIGTAGFVLTSNGASALPSFQAVSGSPSVYFIAYNSATLSNVTGDGTHSNPVFNTATTNIGSAYNTGTGLFTAPSTGTYFVSYNMILSSADLTGETYAICAWKLNGSIINQGVSQCNPFNVAQATDKAWTMTNGVLIALTASDTLGIDIIVSGGAKNVSILSDGNPSSLICGWKLA